MGNCSPKAIAQTQRTPSNTIRVLTCSGSVLYFQGPKVVEEVVKKFPGYGIFGQVQGQGQGASSHPLPHNENLVTSQFYHLLPLETGRKSASGALEMEGVAGHPVENRLAAPPGPVESQAKEPVLEVLPMPRRGDGVWKVKLVIDPKQLEEILSQEVNVEALIAKMREAAASGSVNYTNGTNQPPKAGKTKGGHGWKPNLSSIFRTNSC